MGSPTPARAAAIEAGLAVRVPDGYAGVNVPRRCLPALARLDTQLAQLVGDYQLYEARAVAGRVRVQVGLPLLVEPDVLEAAHALIAALENAPAR